MSFSFKNWYLNSHFSTQFPPSKDSVYFHLQKFQEDLITWQATFNQLQEVSNNVQASYEGHEMQEFRTITIEVTTRWNNLLVRWVANSLFLPYHSWIPKVPYLSKFHRTKNSSDKNFRHPSIFSSILSSFCLISVLRCWTKNSLNTLFCRTKIFVTMPNFLEFCPILVWFLY